MTVKKICCLGLGQAGVPLSVMIAIKCPEIKVTVVHTNPDYIFLWNAKQIPGSVCTPGLDDLVRKCQNKNLFFTTNDETSIKEADMVFIVSESKLKNFGEGEGEALDLSTVEEAARVIAEYSESNKIIVENSAVPLKTAECVRKVLTHNCRPGIKFQVLSNPEFYEEGSAIHNLLHPDRVLIGCEDTPEGLAAAKELYSIFERWVSPKNILTKNIWPIELSKVSSSAFQAQKLANMYALSAICEETNADITELAKTMGKERVEFGLPDSFPRDSHLSRAVSGLIYMCDSLDLTKTADYWRQVLKMNAFYKERFLQRLMWSLNQTARDKKIAVLGFAFYKDTTVTRGSSAIGLCKCLLEEQATLSIYDPKVNKTQVLEDLRAAGCDTPNLEKAVTVHDDVYRAVFQSQVIVVCSLWPEFALLDYNRIFGEMIKPAYLFDGGNILHHTELKKIGFKVYTVGRSIKN